MFAKNSNIEVLNVKLLVLLYVILPAISEILAQ